MEIIPVVIGLTEMVKKTGKVPKQYLQLFAIALGVILFALAYFLPDIYSQFVLLIAAVSSPGIYSAGKSITGALKTTNGVNTVHPVTTPLEPRT